MFKSGPTQTTEIGYPNRNNQKVLGTRGIKGNDHCQSSYKLECQNEPCGHVYGSNGTDNFQRKCPNCQNGMPGIKYQIGDDKLMRGQFVDVEYFIFCFSVT